MERTAMWRWRQRLVIQLQARECQGLPADTRSEERGRNRDPPEGTKPLTTPEWWVNIFLLFELPQSVVICYSSTRKLRQTLFKVSIVAPLAVLKMRQSKKAKWIYFSWTIMNAYANSPRNCKWIRKPTQVMGQSSTNYVPSTMLVGQAVQQLSCTYEVEMVQLHTKRFYKAADFPGRWELIFVG